MCIFTKLQGGYLRLFWVRFFLVQSQREGVGFTQTNLKSNYRYLKFQKFLVRKLNICIQFGKSLWLFKKIRPISLGFKNG